MNKFNIKKKGFTIIELLIVMSIIGIIMGIASHNNSRVIKKSRDASLIINVKHLRTSVYQYSLIHNGRFPDTLSELSPDFIKEIPEKWQGSLASGKFGYYKSTGEVLLFDINGENPSSQKDNKGLVYGKY